MDATPPAFIWTEHFTVNIDALDHQHKSLFSTVNALNEALAKGEDAVVTHSVLENLVEYSLIHFAAEEALMEQHQFPGLEQHKQEHQKFTDDITTFAEKFGSKYAGVPGALLCYLQAWLQQHLLTTDKAYSSYLNARGVY